MSDSHDEQFEYHSTELDLSDEGEGNWSVVA